MFITIEVSHHNFIINDETGDYISMINTDGETVDEVVDNAMLEICNIDDRYIDEVSLIDVDHSYWYNEIESLIRYEFTKNNKIPRLRIVK